MQKTSYQNYLYIFAAIIIITIFCGLVELAVQQDLRMSANDPQIQMAEDTANLLATGKMPQSLIAIGQLVDIKTSLSPFIIVYDENGKPLVASGKLNGQTPVLPQGVFNSVKNSGEERLTWEPQTDVRIAAVVMHFGGQNPGFVLAGRSLREVEVRENNLNFQVLLAWAAATFTALVALWLSLKLKS